MVRVRIPGPWNIYSLDRPCIWRVLLCAKFPARTIADFRVTAGTPFYSWIYTFQSRDLDTFWSSDTFGAKDQPITQNTMTWNQLPKNSFSLNIFFLPDNYKFNVNDCDSSSRGSMIFHKKGLGIEGVGGCWSDKGGRDGAGLSWKYLYSRYIFMIDWLDKVLHRIGNIQPCNGGVI